MDRTVPLSVNPGDRLRSIFVVLVFSGCSAQIAEVPRPKLARSAVCSPVSGAFAPPEVIGTLDYGSDIALADLDGDTHLDIVAIDSDDVWVSWGLGEGLFAPPARASSVDYPRSFALGDIDGDGAPDLIVVGSGTSIYWQRASGRSLAAPAALGFLQGAPLRISAQDLDADGDADILGSSFVIQASFALNQGGGLLDPFAFLRTSERSYIYGSVVAADVDMDGTIDIISADASRNELLWWSGGSGPDRHVSYLPGVPREIRAVDLDADGDEDILSTTLTSSGWHENLGGIFAPRRLLYGGSSLESTPADLDGDLDLDIVIRVNDAPGRWVENMGAAQFAPARVIEGSDDLDLAVGDIDADGDADIVGVETTLEGSDIFLFPSLLPLLPDTDRDAVCDNEDVCPGFDDALDADGDGAPNACDACLSATDGDGDLVPDDCDLCPGAPDGSDTDLDGTPDGCDLCPDDSPDDLDEDGVCTSVDLCDGDDAAGDGDGDGTCDDLDSCVGLSSQDVDGDTFCDDIDLCPGFPDDLDIDEDGIPFGCDLCPEEAGEPDADGDTVCDGQERCPGGDDLSDDDIDGVPDACDDCPTVADPTQGDRWGSPSLLLEELLYGPRIEVGDLDLDGDPDLVTYGELSWIENTGGVLAPRVILDGISTYSSIDLADLDSDGDLDILGVTESDAAIWWFESTGARFAPPAQIGSDPLATYGSARAADLDGDGDEDIISVYLAYDEIFVWENTGGGLFAEPVAWATDVEPYKIMVGDLDSDGNLDVITFGASSLYWHAGGGDLSLGPAQLLSSNTDSVSPLALTDVDGDADIDIVASGSGVFWLENTGGGVFSAEIPIAGLFSDWIGARDLDDDGDEDLLTHTPPVTYAIENTGGAFGGPMMISADYSNYELFGVALADLDTDGDDDLITTYIEPLGLVVIEDGRPFPLDLDDDGICDITDPCVDSDDDGACDDDDLCPGYDDRLDADSDGLPNDCDPCRDMDGDTSCSDVDCDDEDPTRSPGHEERCNGADDDCDGIVDRKDCVNPPVQQHAPPPKPKEEEAGCGCAQQSAPATPLWLALLSLARRRTRCATLR